MTEGFVFSLSSGLTYTGGMCDGDRSAAIIQADGFNSAFSLAHQIGHRLVFDNIEHFVFENCVS